MSSGRVLFRHLLEGYRLPLPEGSRALPIRSIAGGPLVSDRRRGRLAAWGARAAGVYRFLDQWIFGCGIDRVSYFSHHGAFL